MCACKSCISLCKKKGEHQVHALCGARVKFIIFEIHLLRIIISQNIFTVLELVNFGINILRMLESCESI